MAAPIVIKVPSTVTPASDHTIRRMIAERPLAAASQESCCRGLMNLTRLSMAQAQQTFLAQSNHDFYLSVHLIQKFVHMQSLLQFSRHRSAVFDFPIRCEMER